MAITENVISHPIGVTVGVGVSLVNGLVAALPTIINVLTVFYLATLLCYTAWKFYKELKAKRNESKEQDISDDS